MPSTTVDSTITTMYNSNSITYSRSMCSELEHMLQKSTLLVLYTVYCNSSVRVCMFDSIERAATPPARSRLKHTFFMYLFLFESHLSPMYLIIAIQPVVTKDLPISPLFTPYDFLSRCKFSTLTIRRPMVEFYLLTFPRFPLRKKEHKSYVGKNRSWNTLVGIDFTTSALY